MGSAEMMRLVMGGGSSTSSSRTLELPLQGSRVPAEASAAMAIPVLQITAYGDPLTVTNPAGTAPWRVTLRRDSTASRLLMAGMPGADGATGGEGSEVKPRGFKLFPGLFQ